MEEQTSLREAESLRFRFQMNNRLRLESLAAVSKVFREFGEPISDELLSSLVFAVPTELVVSNNFGFVADGNAPLEAYSDKPGGPSGPPPEPPPPTPQPGPPPGPKPPGPPPPSGPPPQPRDPSGPPPSGPPPSGPPPSGPPPSGPPPSGPPPAGPPPGHPPSGPPPKP